jgi:hypothetical protein
MSTSFDEITVCYDAVPYTGEYIVWFGDYDLGITCGYGYSVETAIADLLDQLED